MISTGVDLIEIHQKADRMVRIRTLEEALDDFEGPRHGDTVGFLVQVRTHFLQMGLPVRRDGPAR